MDAAAVLQPPASTSSQAAEPLAVDAGTPAGTSAKTHSLDIAAFMRDHFIITRWARDAVAEGDLAALRQPLGDLANYKYPGVLPAGWIPRLAQLQAAARRTAQAERLSVAAAGVAEMARICGHCHVQHRVALSVHFRRPSEHPEPETESLSARMYRHQWVSSRLWEGITAPSDEAWQAGASALAEIPVASPSTAAPLGPEMQRLLQQVRSIGVQATKARTLDERAASYARLLALCADCHAAARVRVHPPELGAP